MRELTGHKVNPVNDRLRIRVVDEPGSGGANHRYHIDGFDTYCNDSRDDGDAACIGVELLFQNGPIAEAGVNGITHEALLEVLVDRLKGFEGGPYACNENMQALKCLLEAQAWLFKRTSARMERGVEGTHTV